MSVFNSSSYLHESISSILSQTFTDFEFIIIDDCSSDDSVAIIESFRDSRIRLFINAVNIGLTKSLNKGMQYCRGEYIARMDADDIAYPERLETQLGVMEADRDLLLCGSAVRTFGDECRLCKMPLSDQQIRAAMLFNNPVNHPTAFIRKSAVSGHAIFYNETLVNAQDYDFWYQIARKGRLLNLDNPLLHYRLHKKQTLKKPQLHYANIVRKHILADALGIDENVIPLAYFKMFADPQRLSREEIKQLFDFLKLIEMKNQQYLFVEPHILRVELLMTGKRIVDHAGRLDVFSRLAYKFWLIHQFYDVLLRIMFKKFLSGSDLGKQI